MALKIIFKGSLVRVNTAGHQDLRIPPPGVRNGPKRRGLPPPRAVLLGGGCSLESAALNAARKLIEALWTGVNPLPISSGAIIRP